MKYDEPHTEKALTGVGDWVSDYENEGQQGHKRGFASKNMFTDENLEKNLSFCQIFKYFLEK